MFRLPAFIAFALGAILLLTLPATACSSAEETSTLKIGGIPDQDIARLARRYAVFAEYMTMELGVPVEYVPSVDYAAVVTSFTQGEIHLAFFGGLTGIQARLQNPGAQAIVQREYDGSFHSKLVRRADLDINSLGDLKAQAGDLTITFGSENSTSGHLMPRHFLVAADIDPDEDFRSLPNFSGSHDLTWKLVEDGSFDVGALSDVVWDRAVGEGKADESRVQEFYTTPAYFNYNWTVRPDLDETYGEGFTAKVQQALLNLNPEEHGEILDLFSTEKFIVTNNENYQPLEDVARSLGMFR